MATLTRHATNHAERSAHGDCAHVDTAMHPRMATAPTQPQHHITTPHTRPSKCTEPDPFVTRTDRALGIMAVVSSLYLITRIAVSLIAGV